MRRAPTHSTRLNSFREAAPQEQKERNLREDSMRRSSMREASRLPKLMELPAESRDGKPGTQSGRGKKL